MLIRNATLQMSATERACMDVRVMNGCVWEMGAALVKGLYESEIDLRGDVLMPGRMLETPISAADEKALRLLCRRLYREGVRYFVAVQCDISKGKAAAVTQHHRKKDTAQIKRDALKTPLFTL